MKQAQALLLILVSLFLPAQGQANRTASFENLSTRSFRIHSQASCRIYTDVKRNFPDPLGLGKKAWAPEAEGQGLIPDQCSPAAIENALVDNRRSTHAQGAALQNLINKCETSLKRYGKAGLFALQKLGSARYDLCQHPNIRQATLSLPDGTKLNALLALKPGQQRRPLVLVKCGALCNVGDPSHRFMIMHLFDESPFHVLAIANGTGSEFVKTNGHFTLGGFDEGQQLIRIAQLVKEGPLNSRVSSIHFAGVSLGAHAGLFGTLLNEYQSDSNGQRYIQSTLAICPVVDLQYSMNAVFQPSSIQGYIAKKLFLNTLGDVVASLPGIGKLFPFWPFGNVEANKIPEAIATAAMTHYEDKEPKTWLAPFRKASLETNKDLWRYNQFLGYMKIKMTTPTLVIASRDDAAVPYAGNAGRLKDFLANKPETKISVVSTRSGSHCAQSLIYNWQMASSMYRSFILANSPDLLRLEKIKTATFPADQIRWSSAPYPNAKLEYVNFKFKAGSSRVQLIYKTRVQYGFGQCQSLHSEACVRTAKADIPMASIRGASEWLYPPRSSAEAEAMTRWANVNVKAEVPSGELQEWPGTLKWVSYEN